MKEQSYFTDTFFTQTGDTLTSAADVVLGPISRLSERNLEIKRAITRRALDMIGLRVSKVKRGGRWLLNM